MIIRSETTEEFLTEEQCFIKELLNDNMLPDMSLAIARVEPDVTTSLHVLDVDEVYFILEGRGRVEIDGKTNEMGVGDVALIYKGSAQRITNTGDSDLRFLCVCNPRFSPQSYTAITP